MLDWIKRVLKLLASMLLAVAHFVFESFTHYDQVVDDIDHIVSTAKSLKLNVEKEIQDIKNFKFDPKWKTRVINVPAAVEHVKDLQTLIVGDFSERVAKLVEPVHELTLILKQEKAPDAGDPQGAINALSKAQVKLGEVVTMLHSVRVAFDQVSDFVELFKTLRTNIESLDAIFLSQAAPKVTVTEHYRKRQR